MKLKENTDDENYDEYLDEYRIRDIVKKYSDYIRYPIKMLVTKSRPKPKKNENDKDEKTEYEEYQGRRHPKRHGSASGAKTSPK